MHKFKFECNQLATKEISGHLADAVLEIAYNYIQWNGIETVFVQTIPSSPLRWIRHGFDHMLLLHRQLKKIFLTSCPDKKIRTIKIIRRKWLFTLKQSHLNRKERFDAVQNIFSIKPRTAQKLKSGNNRIAVIVIDDVLTTGATMNEAIRCLGEQEIQSIGLTYCYKPHPSTPL